MIIQSVNWVVSYEAVKVQSPSLLYWVTIDEALQVRVISTAQIQEQPGFLVTLLAGKAIAVGVGYGAGFHENVSKGIVNVFRYEDLLRVDHHCDIPIAVRVVAGRLT